MMAKQKEEKSKGKVWDINNDPKENEEDNGIKEKKGKGKALKINDED
ncbi:hypothetical protein [Lacihabitans lacunae]|jgi:hypothetical protein|uniref:Uncharacterized protein n=1 Tax=Lacihabitans lacunae TaxID=1028214 RepID=A0ABV7YUI5_9BACT